MPGMFIKAPAGATHGLPLPGAPGLLTEFLGKPLDLVDRFLEEQQSLTAVDRFSAHHDAGESQGRYYQDLIPLRAPAPGEQFAFEVDLVGAAAARPASPPATA